MVRTKHDEDTQSRVFLLLLVQTQPRPLSVTMLPILLYSLLAVARAAPSQANVDIVPRAPIPGGTVVPLFWDVQAFPDGPTLTLNGTIQEMHKRLLEINPNYDTDFNHTAVAARGLDFGLEKRTDFNGCQLECSLAKWGEPKIKGYDEGLEYLYDHLGVPHMGPGPGACSRVSCSYGTGMWMCNDVSPFFTPRYD